MDENFFTLLEIQEGSNAFDIDTDLEPTNKRESAFQSPLETALLATEISSAVTLDSSEGLIGGIHVNDALGMKIPTDDLASFDSLLSNDGIDWLSGNTQMATANPSLLFIDGSVSDYQSLITGVEADQVIILNPNQDGIQQITSVLEQ